MGLAPYGKPQYKQLILDKLIDLKEDGSFRLNMKYFNYCTGLTMTNKKFDTLFGGKSPRHPQDPVTSREMNLASSIQAVTEEIIMRLAKTIYKNTGAKNLCLAGGVALNCVANGKLLQDGPFDNIWIQPAAGDAGGALGAALDLWFRHNESIRKPHQNMMNGCYLGPAFSNEQIENFLKKYQIPAKKLSDDDLFAKVSNDISNEKVTGWFNGRMEYGPRALGNRSIIGDARSEKMQKVMNLKIKFRESFRPFAPSVLRENLSDFFELDYDSPYMLLTAQVKAEQMLPLTDEQKSLNGLELLNIRRSTIPAVTHVDGSARIQTVHKETNPRYYCLLKTFANDTGCPVIVNTSFNVRGEPIVCTPLDAYKCFMRTEMDSLVLENFYLEKEQQPKEIIEKIGLEDFEPD
jgi:carbamoyltransferase